MRTRRRRLAVLATLLVPSLFVPLRAQQPVFRGGVDVIEVDVSVVDDRGRPIADLLGPEFTVSVDGKARKVVSAEFVSMRPVAPGLRRAETDKPEPAFSSNTASPRGRLIVIGVDRESISSGEGRGVLRSAGKFLDTLGPADKVALFTVPLTGRMIDFTSNHQLVRRELDRMVGTSQRPRGLLNIGISEAIALDLHNNSFVEGAVIDRFCGQLTPGSIAYMSCELEVRTQAGAVAQELRQRADISIRALEAVLEALSEVDGSKSLVWISEGLILDRSAGVSALASLAAAARTTISVLMIDAPLFDVSEAQRSPSANQDRDAQMFGLEQLAGATRGAFFSVSVNADYVFRQMEEELSGYYLLAVESMPTDGDGKRHPIKVSVRRRGATVRARAEFRANSKEPAKAETVEQRLARVLRSPFAATDLPLRLATYAYRDAPTGKVRVMVATEVARTEKAPSELAFGYTLTDADGKIASRGVQSVKLVPSEGPRGLVVEHLGGLLVDPGTYTLKLAAIDQTGKRGSIEHSVQAWQMSGVPLAVGDLMIGDEPGTGGRQLRPVVEPLLTTGRLAAYMELYAEQPDFFDATQVRIEVARDESGPALAAGPGQLVASDSATSRIAWATLPVAALPPGPYVARAVVVRGDQKVGQLSRLFEIAAASNAAKTLVPGAALPSMLAESPNFRKDDVLTAEAIGSAMDLLDKGRPALKAATAAVRSGRFDGAARQAFETGDQFAAQFLRGLELFAKGEMNQAATQFTGALREVPDFGPALLYLGACYAAGGRDWGAVASWQRAVAAPGMTPVAYVEFADALFRLGEAERAISPLRDAVNRWPNEDQLRRRLAVAYAMGLHHADALATVQPYIERHPADAEALLVALHAIYAARLAGQPLLQPDQEKERMTAYARAYSAAKGQYDGLVGAWTEFVIR